MKMLECAVQQSSRSLAELETENHELRLRLQKADETIRALQSGAVDLIELKAVEESLRESEVRLEIELADTKLLQELSAHLIHEDCVDTLYAKITDAALVIMESDFASMQMYYPGRGTAGELRLLASCGLTQEARDFWAWVGVESGTTCAVALRTGKRFITSDMYNCEFVVNTPDHEMFHLAGVRAAQSTPLYSRNGKLLGMISTHWKHNHVPSDRDLRLLDILARQGADLIERKAAEDALQQSQKALTEADRRKDEFLATLAHELRNPLAPIRNALHLMQMAPTGGKAPELLSMMDRQVTHLVRLIDDLLDVSRVSQGKIDLRLDKITLQNAVLAATEASRPLIETNKHILMFDLPEEPLWLFADLTRVAQVVSNLLNNAAKYTPDGGRITVSARSDGTHAVLSVSDTGVGIPVEMLPKVFDLFTQVDHNLDRSQGGLGIGLALVKQLLEMHGGKISAKSSGAGRGSTFIVHLPLASVVEDGVQTNDVPDFVESKTQTGRRVLVVDDNAPSAETIGWMLELSGHQLKLATDAAAALAIVETFQPEVVLLDIGLPGMNGYDLCRKLRKDPRFKDTLMIAQTGWGQDRDRQLAKDAGFNHHLVKPLNLEELSQLLAVCR